MNQVLIFSPFAIANLHDAAGANSNALSIVILVVMAIANCFFLGRWGLVYVKEFAKQIGLKEKWQKFKEKVCRKKVKQAREECSSNDNANGIIATFGNEKADETPDISPISNKLAFNNDSFSSPEKENERLALSDDQEPKLAVDLPQLSSQGNTNVVELGDDSVDYLKEMMIF